MSVLAGDGPPVTGPPYWRQRITTPGPREARPKRAWCYGSNRRKGIAYQLGTFVNLPAINDEVDRACYERPLNRRLRTTIARCATNNAMVAPISIAMMPMRVSFLAVQHVRCTLLVCLSARGSLLIARRTDRALESLPQYIIRGIEMEPVRPNCCTKRSRPERLCGWGGLPGQALAAAFARARSIARTM